MHPCSADAAFDWIRNGREDSLSSNDPNWKGNFVSHLLPSRFHAYAKILHHVEVNYEKIDYPFSEREIEILKIPPCTELRSFVEGLREARDGRKVKWRTLADLLGIPFQPEICHEWFRAHLEPGCWPRMLLGPDDGNLSGNEISEIVSLLGGFTGEQNCFFRFSELPFIGTDKAILFQGGLNELETFITAGKYQFSPEYWWPVDRRWCLCSDYDLAFTIVGGTKDLISRVLENQTLEALEVSPRTRIDSFAPMP